MGDESGKSTEQDGAIGVGRESELDNCYDQVNGVKQGVGPMETR